MRERCIEWLVSDEELAMRQNAKPVQVPVAERGYAHLFKKTVLQADRGADFDFFDRDAAQGFGFQGVKFICRRALLPRSAVHPRTVHP